MLDSLLIKLKASNFIKKETTTQIFSCEICEIFKNTYIQKYLLTTISDFPNPAYSFSSLFGKFYPFQYQQSTNWSFFNGAILFDQMQHYQLCIS